MLINFSIWEIDVIKLSDENTNLLDNNNIVDVIGSMKHLMCFSEHLIGVLELCKITVVPIM